DLPAPSRPGRGATQEMRLNLINSTALFRERPHRADLACVPSSTPRGGRAAGQLTVTCLRRVAIAPIGGSPFEARGCFTKPRAFRGRAEPEKRGAVGVDGAKPSC